MGNMWHEISVGESCLITCCDDFDLLIQSGTCCFRSSVLHPAEKRTKGLWSLWIPVYTPVQLQMDYLCSSKAVTLAAA